MARARKRVAPGDRPKLPNGAILAYKALLFEALADAQKQIEKLIAPRLEKLAKRTDAKTDLAVKAKQVDVIFDRVDKHADKEVKRLIGIPSAIPKKLRDRWRKENVDLIKSIGEQQLDEVTELLDDAFAAGNGVDEVRAKIQERFAVAESKADLIARDQVLKLNAQITQSRHKSVGIVSYIWSTSNDDRVRGDPSGKWPNGMHYDLDGETFFYDDPPVTNEAGDRNHPGEDYQCRCVALPILPVEEDEATE
jgi:SPP1 gp7 family putative phage head morphogenesis protein